MWPRLLVPLLLSGVVAALPSAASEATITAQAPAAPLPWNGAATVNVTVQAPCATLLQDNQAGVTDLELSGSAEAPWIVVTGQKVPWTRDQCDTSTASQATTCTPQPACAANYPRATTTGAITLKPARDAPALTATTVTVTAKGETGKATFTASVGYHGTLNATLPNPTLRVGPGEEVRFLLELEAFTNGRSMIMFSLKEGPARGKLSGLPETVDVDPNVAYLMDHGGMQMWMDAVGAGEPERASVPLTFQAPAEGLVIENVTVEAQLMSYADPSAVSPTVAATWRVEGKEVAAPAAKETLPGPEAGLFAGALVGILAWRNRRQ